MQTLFRLVVLGGLVSVSGCSLFGDDDAGRVTDLPVAALSAPDRAVVGEPVAIALVVQTPSGCHSFERVEADEEPGRLALRAVGRYRGGADVQCGDAIGEIEATYEHVPSESGVLVVTAEGYDGTVEARVSVQ